MFTGDHQDWVAGVSEEETHAVTITIQGGDVLSDRAFASHVHNNYSHANDRFNVGHLYWMNYHWRVFQAQGATARLTISDWSGDDGQMKDSGLSL